MREQIEMFPDADRAVLLRQAIDAANRLHMLWAVLDGERQRARRNSEWKRAEALRARANAVNAQYRETMDAVKLFSRKGGDE